MKKLVIRGGKPLKGEITINGAKNSVVALIPAAIMANSEVVLEGVPDIQDVHSLIEILADFNVKTHFENNVLRIDPSEIISIPMPTGKIQSLRASYYFMGATLTRFGEGVIGLPGGCFLGPRPIDQHIKAFRSLGAEINDDYGVVTLTTPNGLEGAHIYMDVVSVGATINAILASVRAKGRTIIENAAREPEIIDVVTLLNKMGAKIRGAGTSEIRIDGVEELHGVTHTIIPDRIEAGTYISAAVAMGQGVRINNVIYEHLDSFISKLVEMGVKMEIMEDSIYVHPVEQLKMVSIKTLPYPGFATDLQQPVTPVLVMAHGHGTIIDTIYPQRVKHIPELNRMGANIRVDGDMIRMEGPSKLMGAQVKASDLRAGACLVIAGLMAEGETVITGVDNILRGYTDIVGKLQAVGADIEMIEE
ncbi:UDP-N-acetylglucosamine 1-carboxyvinyltransferase [Aerococcaceae bacterium zg-ZUI334]|uniref:UDP-N-acetylglucosamine 1-carboxyvinyltransferase n=1 Tax=Aerococcaceae TaxID=186827 RepID=UPI0013B926EF|nr:MULTISPECIES: UDP-N-acetylglucosamine 1-carboxyvinyltransferase [unclassified Facklamia]MBR7927721.1 UDP-N-acetylglucosamine 1-carboxyvinyltransferase [Aerococcaceae bacterium zg-ZUI334]MBS4462060.1 UDP-N-acetylglucosamine 1-carboxyvinyltransferase [Aerococcaceae bacterium zg-B36]QQD65707.1 UDP-N-acetylglucosamine 1-carboxyvinyltransferase [Aerococcaceae bacterium zg-252]NEW64523.1 UDP-N-acetylglucosamine 1-carboxyvinyltransferase [Facklamia sp. 252]NEW67730.1 UDP-N-acetylglucosamine 1-carb